MVFSVILIIVMLLYVKTMNCIYMLFASVKNDGIIQVFWVSLWRKFENPKVKCRLVCEGKRNER